MTLSAFAQEHRPRIAAELAALSTFAPEYPSPWAQDVEARIKDMAGGKALRGVLALLAYASASSRRPSDDAYRLAAVIELIHAMVLVHDDVMDRDELRRNKLSIYAQYGQLSPASAEHVGASMALCVGDIGFFQAMRALSRIGNAAATEMIMHSCIETGFGQMEDFALGAGLAVADEQAVTRMLLGKTARYTCSMPLASGALLAGNVELATAFDSLGEDLGLLFQVRDDELGLFGETAEIGKPAGSDMREGKKTLYALYLREAAAGADADLLARAYGNPAATDEDLAEIRGMVSRLGVGERVRRFSDRYHAAAREKIAALPVSEEHRALLTDALAFVSSRRT